MKHIANEVMNALKVLSRTTDELYNIENLNILTKLLVSSKTSRKKQNDQNLEKLIDRLPNGIWTTVSQLINEIESNCYKITKDSVSYSPFITNYKDFQLCKTIKYSSGNIITGRDSEIEQTLTILSRKNKRGVVLVGEAGTGKTSIVEAINAKLIEGNVPRKLIGCTIYNMDIPYILSKSKEDPFGQIVNILETASSYDKAILFIDEVHQLLSNKMNDIMKPYLTGPIRFIGATTFDEYYRLMANDSALERRFKFIFVSEPTIDQTINMLINTKKIYEDHHHCIIPDEIIKYLVKNGSRFMGHRKNPDKSFDILDIACSLLCNTFEVVYDKLDRSGNINNIINEIKSIKVVAGNRILNEKFVNLSISAISGLNYDDIINGLDYDTVVNCISKNVIGHTEQIKTASNVVNIFKTVKGNRERPISTLIFAGTKGIGKKTIAKLLSENLYGDNSFIEYDMSGFTSEFMITELKGAPPGYVGYEKSGGLVKTIRNNPQSVLYFKNTHKSHPSIQEYIINCQQNGKISDSSEKVANLNNNVIIHGITLTDEQYKSLTSSKSKTMGFSVKQKETDQMNLDVLKEIIGESLFSSVNEVIVFNSLSDSELENIYNINVDTYLNEYDIDINKEELKKSVLENSKNGKDIIYKLSSNVPKLVFKKLKEAQNEQK